MALLLAQLVQGTVDRTRGLRRPVRSPRRRFVRSSSLGPWLRGMRAARLPSRPPRFEPSVVPSGFPPPVPESFPPPVPESEPWAQSVAGPPPDQDDEIDTVATRSAGGGIGSEAEEVLAVAERAAAQLSEQIQARAAEAAGIVADAEARRAEADRYSERMRAAADAYAEEIRRKSDEEAARAHSRAEEQERRILTEAEEEARRIRAEAEERARDIEARARELEAEAVRRRDALSKDAEEVEERIRSMLTAFREATTDFDSFLAENLPDRADDPNVGPRGARRATPPPPSA